MNDELPINPIQAMVDGMNAAHQRERATTQMTLGRLIELLKTLPAERSVVGLGELMSYRGYYCDLSLEPVPEVVTVAVLLGQCRAAMGRTFEGYKGGDFLMGETTPLWVAQYGSTGDRLMDLNVEADPITVITATDED